MSSVLDIHKINQTFIDQMPGLFTVMDTDSRCIIANKQSIKWLGMKTTDDMLGKTYHQIPCRVAEQHDAFVHQDQMILQNAGYGRILGFYCYANNDWKAILAEKYPLKNEKGDIIALASYITDITNANIIDISRFLHLTAEKYPVKLQHRQSGYLITDDYPDIKLTESQSKCLFFLLRGKTAKEISTLLAISVRTAEHYIEAIKTKMDCPTKSLLIEKAINNGYMNIVPHSLFDMIE